MIFFAGDFLNGIKKLRQRPILKYQIICAFHFPYYEFNLQLNVSFT